MVTTRAVRPKQFPREDWDLDFRAELYKQEFYATDTWLDRDQRDALVAPLEASTTEELKKLRELTRDRPNHIGEIVQEQQALVLIGYWYDLLRIGPTSHPRTTELLHATLHLAGSVASYFKARFNRVRPWVVDPDLFPPIPSPGLPSYPGGHSAQMYLMAELLTSLVPGDKAKRVNEFKKIAQEVALNRERAGLNFESDTAASEKLAERLYQILTTKCERFMSTLKEAKAEW